MKISLIHLPIVSMEAPLNGFLWAIMSWPGVNLSCLLPLEIYSFRRAITHKVLPRKLYIQTYLKVFLS